MHNNAAYSETDSYEILVQNKETWTERGLSYSVACKDQYGTAHPLSITFKTEGPDEPDVFTPIVKLLCSTSYEDAVDQIFSNVWFDFNIKEELSDNDLA